MYTLFSRDMKSQHSIRAINIDSAVSDIFVDYEVMRASRYLLTNYV
jgi:hypothetical protein